MHVVAGQPSVSTGEQGIEWAPLSSPSRLPFTGTSREKVHAALIQAFGPFPIRLKDQTHNWTLKGMIAAAEGSEPYRILLSAMMRCGEIEVREV